MINSAIEKLNDISEEAFAIVDTMYPEFICGNEGVKELLSSIDIPERAAEFMAEEVSSYFRCARSKCSKVAVIPSIAAMYIGMFRESCS